MNNNLQKAHWIIIDDYEYFRAKCSKCEHIADSRLLEKNTITVHTATQKLNIVIKRGK